MAKPDLNKSSMQDEFHIPLAEVLAAHIDADEVLEDDRWSFVDAGDHLVIVRKREVISDFRPEKRKAKEEAEAETASGKQKE